jgi:hypothetical protein
MRRRTSCAAGEPTRLGNNRLPDHPRPVTIVRLGLVTVLALMVTGCSSGCEQLPADNHVTGKEKSDPTWSGAQSETGANVSNTNGKQVITVTYNDDTDAAHKIAYTSTTRTTSTGATLLGWSYSTDSGTTWKYGGSVAPPSGWSVLWGDPAITSDFADQRYVFISNLAVPKSKMPSGGTINGPLNDYLGGACIALSDDGGITFKIHQCVTNDNDFYDGGSMVAAGSSYDRRVFASFVDVDKHQIDIWVSPSDTGVFKLMPNPFPNMKMFSHPRLRFDRGLGALYVAALSAGGLVYINRYDGGWGKPVVASLATAGNPDVSLSDRKLRTGYQFSFDVGAASANGGDGVRVVYTVLDQKTQKLYIRGSYCDYALTGCKDAPEWGTTPGNLSIEGQQFNPLVRAFPGFFSLPAEWKVTYMSTDDDPGGNTISYKQGNLAVLPNGKRIFVPFNLVKGQVVCPDNRGYWGDYDELQFAGFDKDSTAPRFVLPHTDSTKGCPTRWEYTSTHVHVSAVVFK